MNSIKTILVTFASICMGITQAYAANITSEDVKILNAADSIILAGTLSAPETEFPKAAIILATGSGAQNRDEELLGHKPFKVLAEHLSRYGYAVLRMDDRGTGESTGNFEKATVQDFRNDIAHGLDWINKRYHGIPAGVIGHSEGGSIAIKLAGDNRCDFIVTLAAPAWPGDSIIMSQCRAIATGLTGHWDGEQTQRAILNVIKSPINSTMARISLYMILRDAFGPQADIPKIRETIERQIDVLVSDHYRDMVRYDPATDISGIKKPWLALNGDHDVQVLPGNLTTIKTLCPTVHTVFLKGHNHLMQRCVTGLPEEYALISEDISQETLDTITAWLDSLFDNRQNP